MAAALFTLLWLLAAQAPEAGPEQGPLLLAQRKQYDQGNCYQWKLCKGDSIGNMWLEDPCFCAIEGGRSWMDRRGKCHDLLDGPFKTECR